ncbi:MAG: hypothetical protein A2909_01965 [Candidatus Tagabacteria bacterium RIFCSPLOWO2_01_FULL_39_11]|uniref:50S ribosomal protein L35 n=1 Tax=Candidatus Tagabacteria bacterium RIFCSPLOWO2_01_FULL_39_11 TaxID=1802295 RepID=A0A1G2LQE8_9BACT|nr:MAG: hypothetical protein A2909_01965 [Candidatus Tagabacteria bacterium RIFCSPLOWO2_01_FULL_39_11]
MLKTNKSFSKRLKVTRNKKVLGRKPGQDHFNAKEPRSKQLHQKKWRKFNISNKKLKQYLPHL